MYTGTAEISFPIGLPDELGVLGKLFTDVGSLTIIDDEGATIADSRNPRLSVGIGFSAQTPIGPVRVDMAKALVREDEDDTELFRFNFGTRF